MKKLLVLLVFAISVNANTISQGKSFIIDYHHEQEPEKEENLHHEHGVEEENLHHEQEPEKIDDDEK